MLFRSDILAEVARLPAPQRPYCVGFAAESQDVTRLAREKRLRKGIPMIVANHGPSTFGQDDNALWVVEESQETEVPRADKLTLARALVQLVSRRLT